MNERGRNLSRSLCAVAVLQRHNELPNDRTTEVLHECEQAVLVERQSKQDSILMGVTSSLNKGAKGLLVHHGVDMNVMVKTG